MDELQPEGYDDALLAEGQQQHKEKDPFKKFGVSQEDKMTFFLLKWVFNAIKHDSDIDDPRLKGKPYVTKKELIKQLAKNEELMRALDYDDKEHV
mmetsp:Transcript_16336/g.11507  ORF Transcript_16336/g.11507 Transcript_16336/m.11507 type:complete len:95 (+) Transcript_16336:934-1218(+)